MQMITMPFALPHTKPNHKSLKQLNVLTSAVFISIYAFANQANANQTLDLSTTVVTGQKIERTLLNTTAGTSVVNEFEIEEASAINLDEVIDYAPNVNVVETGNYNSFAIRGINGRGIDGGGTELSSMLINGAYLPVSAFRGNFALWDIEQIVVNKGPQSTTQGRNALAGTIIMQTKDPVFDNTGSVSLGVGSHGAKNAAVMLNGKLSDTFAVRLSAQHNEDKGQITNIYLNDDAHDFSENTSVNLKLRYKPSDATEAKLSIGYIEDGRGVRQTCTEANSTEAHPCKRGELKASQAIKPHHDFKTDYQTLALSHQLNKQWGIKSITSRTHIQEDDYEDWTRYNPEAPNYPKQNGKPLPVSTGYNGWKRDTISQELRVNYESNRIKTSTGLYGAKSETRRARTGNSPFDFVDFLGALDTSGTLSLARGQAFLPLALIQKDGVFDVDTVAIFNDTDFNVNDKLVLNAGLRLEKETIDVRGGLSTARASDLTGLDSTLPNSITTSVQLAPNQPPQQVPLATAACVQNKQLCGANLTTILGAFSKQQLPALNTLADGFLASTVNRGADVDVNKETSTVLPKIGFRYNFDANNSFGYLYSRGYRSGGAGVNTGTGQAYEYKPEFLDNHEISLRSISDDKRLNFSANFFWADWTDQQVTVFGGSNSYDQFTANAGKSQLYGAEIETKYKHDNGVFSFANIGMVETEYKNFVNGNKDYSGNQFANAPTATANVGIGYYAGNGLNGNIATRFSKGSYQEAGNFRKSPDYAMTDLRLGYEADSWRVNGYVKNLFDKKVEHRYWSFTNTAFASTPVFLPERSFGMNVQYDF